MSNRAWMPLSIDDYMADTLHLSAAEHGAYMLLIMRYWKDGGLPDDEHLIMRFSRLSPESGRKAATSSPRFSRTGGNTAASMPN